MHILYEGMIGSAANPKLGWGLIIGGAILLVLGLLLGLKDYISDGLVGVIIGIITVCLIIGIINLIDSRKPIIKMTLDNTVTYQEINEKYELRKIEGEIYTFEVKNVTPDEWQSYLNK